MSTISANGQKLHYSDTGPSSADGGTAIVFSHGALLDATVWETQVAELSPAHRCITWDARLHGGTVDSGDPFDVWDSTRDLLALLDGLDVRSAVLVGHSQGGFFALRAALLAPGRVSGLVLIDTMATAWPPEAVSQLSGAADGFDAAGPDAVAPALLPGLVGPERQERWLSHREEVN